MGEVADMLIDGTMCEWCGMLIDGESPGYPRRCRDCNGEYTFEDLREDTVPLIREWIDDINKTLSYTKHTVSRKKLLRKRYFWECEIEAFKTGKPNRFWDRYPHYTGRALM